MSESDTNVTNKKLCIFSYISYYANDPIALTKHLPQIPEAWQLIASSYGNSEDYSYRALAFINETTKEIVFANAGSDLRDIHDLRDNLAIYAGYTPYKTESIRSFFENVRSINETRIQNGKDNFLTDYSIYTTGHSLGGVLSDLFAVMLKSKGIKVLKSTTFESPGSKEAVEYAIDNNLFDKTSEINLDTTEFNVYTAKPNFVNTACEHFGEIVMLIFKHHQQEEEINNNLCGSISNKLYYIYQKLVQATGVNKIHDFAADHQLEPFIEHFSLNNPEKREFKVSDWHSSYGNQPIGIKPSDQLSYLLNKKMHLAKEIIEKSRKELSEKVAHSHCKFVIKFDAAKSEFAEKVDTVKSDFVDFLEFTIEELQAIVHHEGTPDMMGEV